MKYKIHSTKGYWLPKGNGYTQQESKAGIFDFEDLKNMNLDGCTLHALKQWELQQLDNSERNSD